MPGGPMADQGCHGKLTCNRAVTGCHRLSQAVTAVTAVTGCHMLSHAITSVTGHPKADCFCIVAASCIFTLEYLTPKSAARAIRHGAPRNALENQAMARPLPYYIMRGEGRRLQLKIPGMMRVGNRPAWSKMTMPAFKQGRKRDRHSVGATNVDSAENRRA